MKTTIKRTIEAEQWTGENGPLPAGVYLCKPEICWSHMRQLVYFTYAELRPQHWMEVKKHEGVGTDKDVDGFFEGGIQIELKTGEKYWRKTLPFAFYSVKSEASMSRNHHAVYVEKEDAETVALFMDYCGVEKWPNPLPPRAEYRDVDGAYGRGYRPIYMKPGDWLLKEEVPDGHNNLGYKTLITVVSNEHFQRMK